MVRAVLPRLMASLVILAVTGCVTREQVATVQQDLTDPGLRGTAVREADLALEARVRDAWGAVRPAWRDALTATASEGRVLVTGRLSSPEEARQAIGAAVGVAGIGRVFDRIETGAADSFVDRSRDLWITTQLRSRLTFDTRTREVNYTITTESGTIYLMGVARDAAERAVALGHARGIPYVRQVVDLTRLASQAP